MIIRKSKIYLLILLLLACTPDMYDDPIPLVPFVDIVINLNLPEYINLRTDGGSKELSTGGVRGIIVYRVNASTYFAYERNCSYHPMKPVPR
jgi:hypothetical protein